MAIEAVQKLPRTEKLRLMEALWVDLSLPGSQYQSPAWHANELAETERRVAADKEQVMEWGAAKKKLRCLFE
jgi:hypothetical protein